MLKNQESGSAGNPEDRNLRERLYQAPVIFIEDSTFQEVCIFSFS